MKLVHLPLMGGRRAVTFGTARKGARQGPSSLYQMQQLTHQRPVYQSPYCCIMVRCSAISTCRWRLKGWWAYRVNL